MATQNSHCWNPKLMRDTLTPWQCFSNVNFIIVQPIQKDVIHQRPSWPNVNSRCTLVEDISYLPSSGFSRMLPSQNSFGIGSSPIEVKNASAFSNDDDDFDDDYVDDNDHHHHWGEKLLCLLKHLLLVPALAQHRRRHIQVGFVRIRFQDVANVAPFLTPPDLRWLDADQEDIFSSWVRTRQLSVLMRTHMFPSRCAGKAPPGWT